MQDTLNISSTLDQFPAVQLRDVSLVVKQLIAWSEEKRESGKFLLSLPISKLVDAGFRPAQVRSALEVFQKIHEERYGKTVGGGLAAQPPPTPKISGGEIQGLLWVLLQVLDVELSKREGVSPSGLTSLCYSLKDGIYLLGSKERSCPITQQQYESLSLVHSQGAARLKQIAKTLKMTQSNASRDIRELNERFSASLGNGRPLIKKTGAVGFFINQAEFSLSGS